MANVIRQHNEPVINQSESNVSDLLARSHRIRSYFMGWRSFSWKQNIYSTVYGADSPASRR